MIVFVEKGMMEQGELDRLREYLDKTNTGVVIVVNSVEAVRVNR